MELDELKQQLKQKMNESSLQKTNEDFTILLTQKTNSVLQKLKRSLLIEVIICFAFTLLFFIVGIFNQHKGVKIYFTTFAIVCLLLFIVLLLLYKRMQKNNNAYLSVKENLEAIYLLLKEYSKRNFQLTMALIPICVLFAAYLGYRDGLNIQDIDTSILSFFASSKQMIVFLVLYIVILTISTYFFTKWYLKKLYGTYLKQLQDCINELQ